MRKNFDPVENYNLTKKQVGYIPRRKATQKDYDAIGFMSGLEVHQQLLTEKKLFCNCPAGIFQKPDDYDAEIVRHMRPTLSELGEYDGTALMEFKTRKNIIYKIKNRTACTYEVDDTPPFPINREALEKAICISLLSKLNIVGEVHITRKQYLDGSIPTGFQRTAIIGVEGTIPLKNKTIRLIQLSIEEDSCREISDIGHERIYRTDRLGMPLIETVTYPDMVNPDEVKEACNYIRFLNRSTGMVRTGIGAGRQDVNVSCKGGTRIEIKGVSHTKWIPELTHNECYRQWALLKIRDLLNAKKMDVKNWHVNHKVIEYSLIDSNYKPILDAQKSEMKLVAVSLPGFHKILSHFTQPGQSFANEISDRLKVIACLEKPNMLHSEEMYSVLESEHWDKIAQKIDATEDDALMLFWTSDFDMQTAIETIEERCKMAFEGVPNETRKSFKDGTTIFERVLPGADRMYPDTDSVPIPLSDEYIESLKSKLPNEIIERYKQLSLWQIPEDTYTYIFRNNLYPLIEKIILELNINPVFVGTFIGHSLKWIEGHFKPASEFSYEKIYDLFVFLTNKKIHLNLAKRIMQVSYQYPLMDFDSILESIKFQRKSESELLEKIEFLKVKFEDIKKRKEIDAKKRWIMGQIHSLALGNVDLAILENHIVE